uniref:Uncharacterized protein n=1 Tax=Romanomermis culicivorax TaxID=13658 RepID=A0A915L036_ROMCU
MQSAMEEELVTDETLFHSKGSTFCHFGSSAIKTRLPDETLDETVANSDKLVSDYRPPSIPWRLPRPMDNGILCIAFGFDYILDVFTLECVFSLELLEI